MSIAFRRARPRRSYQNFPRVNQRQYPALAKEIRQPVHLPDSGQKVTLRSTHHLGQLNLPFCFPRLLGNEIGNAFEPVTTRSDSRANGALSTKETV
jgi:hypothetical protein